MQRHTGAGFFSHSSSVQNDLCIFRKLLATAVELPHRQCTRDMRFRVFVVASRVYDNDLCTAIQQRLQLCGRDSRHLGHLGREGCSPPWPLRAMRSETQSEKIESTADRESFRVFIMIISSSLVIFQSCADPFHDCPPVPSYAGSCGVCRAELSKGKRRVGIPNKG